MTILAIDQGTTSSRAILFDADLQVREVAQREFTQHFPDSGWVEHDPEEIWQSVLETCKAVLDKAGPAAAIGITNQRETMLIWDRETGEALHRAVVWQDRRTADFCADLRDAGHEAEVTARSGLLLDPYFSASKAKWLLDNVPGARAKADAGKLARQLCHSAFLPTSTDTGNGAGNQFNQPGSVLADKGKNNRRIQW